MHDSQDLPSHIGSLQDQLLGILLFVGTEWVLYLLLGLSVISLGIALERWWHLARTRDNIEQLHAQLSETFVTQSQAVRNHADAARTALQAQQSYAASVCLKGLDALPHGPAAVEEVMLGAMQLSRLKMERGLAFLGTLGNNAPFIGLFGTVLGIIRAFRDLSVQTSAGKTMAGSSAVMAGIAEALVATAVGLLVALPAVALFNMFQRAIRTRMAGIDVAARIILAHAKATPCKD